MSKLKELQASAKKAKSEDSKPKKESSNVSAENANPFRDDGTMASPTDDGGNFLKSFLKATPFFDLFEYIANNSTGGRESTRVPRLKVSEPMFYKLCRDLDIVLRFSVVIIVVMLATKAALKVLE